MATLLQALAANAPAQPTAPAAPAVPGGINTFQSLLQRDTRQYVKMVIFGDGFTGKTRAAGRLAKLGYTLVYIDMDNASLTLKNDPGLTDEDKSRILLIPINDIEGIANLAVTLFDAKKQKSICRTHGFYNCARCVMQKAPVDVIDLTKFDPETTIVVLDSGRAITDAAIEKVRGDRGGDYKFQLDDWGALSGIMNTFLRQQKQYPMHTILLTGVEYTKNEANPLMKSYPQLGSSTTSGNSIMYFSDLVYASNDAQGYKYVCLPHQARGYAVGSRLGIDLLAPGLSKDIILGPFFKEVKPTTA